MSPVDHRLEERDRRVGSARGRAGLPGMNAVRDIWGFEASTQFGWRRHNEILNIANQRVLDSQVLGERLPTIRPTSVGALPFRGSHQLGLKLHTALYAGDEARAIELILAGADVHYVSKASRQTCMHRACMHGLMSAALLMIQRGASPFEPHDCYRRTPLDYSRHLKHREMIPPLIAAAESAQIPVPSKERDLQDGVYVYQLSRCGT